MSIHSNTYLSCFILTSNDFQIQPDIWNSVSKWKTEFKKVPFLIRSKAKLMAKSEQTKLG